MPILVISDIHANLTALEAVLSDAGEFEATWCLGDLVGYGPDPNECIARIQELPNLTCIIGNHDAAALKRIETEAFNPEARSSIYWTQGKLSKESWQFLGKLSEKTRMDDVTLAHGSPRHPVWEYLLDTSSAAMSFQFFNTLFCFVGHTHLPVIYTDNHLSDSVELNIPHANQVITLPGRSIVNPGSVGQPRDRDTRASYALFDTTTKHWDYRRVPYDILEVQERMKEANLPERHIIRLSAGW